MSQPLPKMSDARRQALARLGIQTLDDCLFHFPLRYEDETTVRLIRDVGERVSTIAVTVENVQLLKKRQSELVVSCKDASATVDVRFLKVFPGLRARFEALRHGGQTVWLFGEVRLRGRRFEMFHPKVMDCPPAGEANGVLMPIYSLTEGITQAFLRKLTRRALAVCDLSDTLPAEVRDALALWSWAAAVRQLHYPALDEPDTRQAWARIRFDELLAQQLWLKIMRRTEAADNAPPLNQIGPGVKGLIARLPFELTEAQKQAWAEISNDLSQRRPMRRLLQGDVGSGKTVVAALAVCQAVDNGYQAAVMAPTDILAVQHFSRLSDWFSSLGIRCGLLSSSVERREAKACRQALAEGDLDVVVGTHALFQDQVVFRRLGLLLIDEQHRFGVEQRFRLRRKGEAPHQLLMSATPIPRTLAMTYLADVDLSVIDQLPPGRQPVKTKLINASRRMTLIDWVANACRQHRQVYWVCPLIDESDWMALQTVRQACDDIRARCPDLRVEIIHGKMKPAEKRAVMDAFSAGEIDILTATTVIEVGVDVPQASIMVIESAQRFGLAQLHQLRGRVGRGCIQAICVLMYELPLSAVARERLKILFETSDGFEVARRDMVLRGAGDYYGVRQSGMPLLRFADPLRDAAWINLAAETAEIMLDNQAEVARHLTRYRYDRTPQVKV